MRCTLQPARRILRNHRQRQRLGQAQLASRFIEIGKTGRTHTLDVATVRCVVEISLENLLLGIKQLQLHRPRHLLQLAPWRTRIELPQQPSQLHGDGGTALRIAMAHIGDPRAARQTVGIEAWMPAIPAIFVQQHRILQLRRDVMQWHPQAITIVAGQGQPHQPAMFVIDRRGGRQPVAQARMRP